MEVTRVFESPRVTKPYTDAQWHAIRDLGDKIDDHLDHMDVRLTMGGEPTFVSVSDREGAEWNTAALGPTKRGYALELLNRLRTRYGGNGFLHFGQGKWYPGEQLPRWALSIYWRTDGQPCWEDPTLFADERQRSAYTVADARRFMARLCERLGVGGQTVVPGYEDVFYYLWRERRLPANVDPFDSRLEDEMERARLRRVFEQKLDSVVGYALPIQAGEDGSWVSGPWFLRDERMYLFPGDSPMGYRLPLDSLPWVDEADAPVAVERDPFDARRSLPGPAQLLTQNVRATARQEPGGPLGSRNGEAPIANGAGRGGPGVGVSEARQPAKFESAAWLTRTAMCVEVRNGVLYVFMPPLPRLEDYLALVAQVEATARDLKTRIVMEGYPPPRDPRLKVLQVTPDPGVIEVNIHPASNWADLVDHTEFLYEAAFETRLSTEKFMADGRHTGTGGGNHFVLGGATPADSPFLRRPDVLASLLAYWVNHPSLSYLFSGLFIGPTSQAPRIDEARNDQVYELELAFQEIHRRVAQQGDSVPPWMIDRALRNILPHGAVGAAGAARL
ncbi:hypothetical protein G6F57_014136 [Rhizopus arrhizus]|nr:hypothetical protein G6F57_014136 [Rhizopus arrhizus]